ncbi:MAG: metallophosphoesterase [Candidatus Diapherotrites archaeon]|nr:metallophosphoesterase [Candidatus Diapherotrites archaeon]
MKKSVKINGLLATNTGALISKEFVVIADLHLGYERAMVGSGLFVPQYQFKIIMEKLEMLPEREMMILNGDIKHEFSENNPQEWTETRKLFDYLSERFDKIIVVRGNHDNYLRTVTSKYKKVEFVDYLEIDDKIIAHGHKDFLPLHTKKLKIIGHEHPSVTLRDDVGVSLKLPCFLYNDELIVMPAFSPLAAGTDVTRCRKEDLLSPVLKRIGIGHLNVLAIDEEGCIELPEVYELVR